MAAAKNTSIIKEIEERSRQIGNSIPSNTNARKSIANTSRNINPKISSESLKPSIAQNRKYSNIQKLLISKYYQYREQINQFLKTKENSESFAGGGGINAANATKSNRPNIINLSEISQAPNGYVIKEIENFYNIKSYEDKWLVKKDNEVWDLYFERMANDITRIKYHIISSDTKNLDDEIIINGNNKFETLQNYAAELNKSEPDKFIFNIPQLETTTTVRNALYINESNFDEKMKLLLRSFLPQFQANFPMCIDYFLPDILYNNDNKQDFIGHTTTIKMCIVDKINEISCLVSIYYYKPSIYPNIEVPYCINYMFVNYGVNSIYDNNGYFLFEPLIRTDTKIRNLEYINLCGTAFYKNTQRINILSCLNKIIKDKDGHKIPNYKTVRFFPKKEHQTCYTKTDFENNGCSYLNRLHHLDNIQQGRIAQEKCENQNIINVIKTIIEISIYKNLPLQVIITIEQNILFKDLNDFFKGINIGEKFINELYIIEINHKNICVYVLNENNTYALALTFTQDKISLKAGQKIFFIINKTISAEYAGDMDPPFDIESFMKIENILTKDHQKLNGNEKSFFDIININADTYNIFISSYLARYISFTSMIAYYFYIRCNKLSLLDEKQLIIRQRLFATNARENNGDNNFNYYINQIFLIYINYFFYFTIEKIREKIAKDINALNSIREHFERLINLETLQENIDIDNLLFYKSDILNINLNSIIDSIFRGRDNLNFVFTSIFPMKVSQKGGTLKFIPKHTKNKTKKKIY